ncbi:MAG: 2-oxoacid:acceptor oxidoreductase family protein [bacterium]|jgi:2-oxoglutarate ferredoxin oxidoreductase subunit gamma
MTTKVIMAGFGGQGVVLMGTLLSYSAMVEGKHTTFFPSYGAEMRGGTANCSVVVSDDEIASPVVNQPDCVVAMNIASLEKFESRVKPGGTIFVNSSLIEKKVERDDVDEVRIPANDIAEELGNSRAANMVILGGLLKKTGAVKVDAVIGCLEKVLSERAMALLDLNKKALRRGFEEI